MDSAATRRVPDPDQLGQVIRRCPAEVGLCGLGKLATFSLNIHFLIIVIFSHQKTPQNKKLWLIITPLTCSNRTPGLCGLQGYRSWILMTHRLTFVACIVSFKGAGACP